MSTKLILEFKFDECNQINATEKREPPWTDLAEGMSIRRGIDWILTPFAGLHPS